MKMKNTKGFFTLEALIAVIVFMLGVLMLLKLQLTQMQVTGDSQYRTQAAYMAENLMSKISLDSQNIEGYINGSSPNYTDWINDLNTMLPGVTANPPTIVKSISSDNTVLITITINWKVPQSASVSHYSIQGAVI
jgi:type IV pilus assembly protein PilV